MSVATLAWFTLGACLVYAVAIDPKVYLWLVLQTQRLLQNLGRVRYRLLHNPDSPWVRYKVNQNANRTAAMFIKQRDSK